MHAMTRPIQRLIHLLLALAEPVWIVPASADCAAFAIQREAALITVEPVSIADGQMQAFSVAVGQSADQVQRFSAVDIDFAAQRLRLWT